MTNAQAGGRAAYSPWALVLRHCFVILVSSVAIALLVLPGHAADDTKPLLPDSEYRRMLDHSAEVIRAALKDMPTQRSITRAQTAAVLMAAYAQQSLGGIDGQQRATARDAALELAALIKKKDFATALRRLDGIATLKPNPKAKKEKSRLLEHTDVDDLMSLFRPAARGGLNIEAKLDELGGVGATLPPAELTPALTAQIYLAAVTGEIIADHVPEDRTKTKQWQGFSRDMQQHAVALTEAVRLKDGKAAAAALGRLNQTCAACHKAFR
jgi:hypothetical protein